MSLHSSNKCKISRSPLRRKLVLLFFFNLILGFFWDCNLFTFLSSLSPLHVLLYISSHTASNPWLPLSSIDKVCIYIYVYVYIPKCNLGSGRGTARPIGVCFPQGVTTTLAHNLTQTPLALCVVLRFVGCSPSGLSCPLVSSLLLHNFAVTLVRLNGYNFWCY